MSTTIDVFLSYSRTDAPVVRQIQSCLTQAGLATFLDRDQLPAGQPWLPALEQGIAHCAAVAVFVGPAGLGTWQQREVQLALDRQAEAERAGRAFPVIPVLLPKVEDPPGGFLRLQTWVDLRSDLADPAQLHLLLTSIRGQAPANGSTLREALCPYRGLLPFREEDAGLFFGREDTIDTLLGKIRDHNLVTLVGRSGSGKSSIVYAGLVPALRRRAAGRTWSILSLRPGPEPLHALVRLFDPPPVDLPPFAADQRVEEQVTILRTADDALGRRIRSLLATLEETGTDRLLLYVDQWEELYTQALRNPALDSEPAEREVARFIDLLLDATRTSPCTVVLTVRADFYADLLKHGPLASAGPPGLVNLGPLRREGLKAAIEKPAKAVGLTVDPPLVKELVDEVCNDLGKLPLLEYALKETWRHREGQRLTLNAYGQAGGIDGAVAQRANQIFTGLSQAQQAAACRLFVSLVTPGEGREDTRARAVYPEQDNAIATVIDKFSAADARLLVTGEDAPSARRLVEISHETLIREWDLLKEWIESNREALRRREHIRVRMQQWEEKGRDPTLLLPSGLPLEEGRKLLDEPGDVLPDEVQPYIVASIAVDEERVRQAEAERQRELAAAQRLASVAIGLTLLVVMLGPVYVYFWLPGIWSSTKLNVLVRGKFDPWLAGMPNESRASSCTEPLVLRQEGRAFFDTAPQNSPVEIRYAPFESGQSLVVLKQDSRSFFDTTPQNSPVKIRYAPFEPGQSLVFKAIGLTPPEFVDDPKFYGPDGDADDITSHDQKEQNGISDIRAPRFSLIGVFLGSDQPYKSPTPEKSEFAEYKDHVWFAPKLKQVFFIGNGTNYMGIRRRIIIPQGATRLFLGTMDSCNWEDNVGAFIVTVIAL